MPPPAPQPVSRKVGLWARLRAYFLAGVLVTAPLSFTLYLAWLFITLIDDWVSSLLPPRFNPESYLPFSVPGLGLIIVVVAMVLIGSLTAGFLGRLIIGWGESLVSRIPAIRSIYAATKQILETVLAQSSNAFRQVVLVEYPRRGIWAIGFITGVTEGEIQELTDDTVVTVFVPTTPNPTSGFLLFFPRSDIKVLDMSIEDGIKLVVSAGIVVPSAERAAEDHGRTARPSSGRSQIDGEPAQDDEEAHQPEVTKRTAESLSKR